MLLLKDHFSESYVVLFRNVLFNHLCGYVWNKELKHFVDKDSVESRHCCLAFIGSVKNAQALCQPEREDWT